MTSVYRVFLKPAYPNPEEGDQYLFDLEADEEKRPLTDRTYFGLWGPPDDAGDRYPLLLQPDGQIDLGTECNDAAYRYQRTNLLEKALVEGQYVSIWMADEDRPSIEQEYTMRIARTTLLAG